MVNPTRIQRFLESEDAVEIRKELEKMMKSKDFNTKSTYTPSSIEDQPFVEKHMRYLSLHMNVKPEQYLSNLKLMTRVAK
jgi:hypothetical protein